MSAGRFYSLLLLVILAAAMICAAGIWIGSQNEYNGNGPQHHKAKVHHKK